MADIKLVIKIDEDTYKDIKRGKIYTSVRDVPMESVVAIANGTPLPKGHNENNYYAECDQFVCSECGIELQDWYRVERDEDDGDITYHEYTFRYCPNCGAKMEVTTDADR